MVVRIQSGKRFTDTSGQPVHAHGAGVLLPRSHPQGGRGKVYLVGTAQKLNVSNYWLSEGINLYSSFDLEHWAFEGRIFANTTITTSLPSTEPPVYRIERPKLVYNQLTRQYVLYFHLDSARFLLGMVGVCTASRVAGPYTFVRGYRPDGQRSLDLTLYQEHGGQAYLVRSVDNLRIGISRLTPDYLNTTSEGEISSAPRAEAPAMWRDPPSRRDPSGSYYLLVSGLSGWRPNAAVLYRASPPLEQAAWQRLGNPSRNSRTFNSQPTAVLPHPYPYAIPLGPSHAHAHQTPRRQASGGDTSSQPRLLLYMGDRWNHAGPGSVGNASYVWLPMVRGQPGQRTCKNTSSRLGACVPGAWGYVIPRLPGGSHTVRWQPRQFLGTSVQSEVDEGHPTEPHSA